MFSVKRFLVNGPGCRAVVLRWIRILSARLRRAGALWCTARDKAAGWLRLVECARRQRYPNLREWRAPASRAGSSADNSRLLVGAGRRAWNERPQPVVFLAPARSHRSSRGVEHEFCRGGPHTSTSHLSFQDMLIGDLQNGRPVSQPKVPKSLDTAFWRNVVSIGRRSLASRALRTFSAQVFWKLKRLLVNGTQVIFQL